MGTHFLTCKRFTLLEIPTFFDYLNSMDGSSIERLNEKRVQLAELREKHRDLDASIEALTEMPIPDQLRIQRMKRQKLQLKDQIRVLSAQINPDIIA